jgi:hypothetical protein
MPAAGCPADEKLPNGRSQASDVSQEQNQQHADEGKKTKRSPPRDEATMFDPSPEQIWSRLQAHDVSG